MKLLLALALAFSSVLFGQTPKSKPHTISFQVCVKYTPAFGGDEKHHVRFTDADHIAFLLELYRSRNEQDLTYYEWERASRSIDWFGGTVPVSTSYVKKHMPRAMLLELEFPQGPTNVEPASLKRLRDTEKNYENIAKKSRDYIFPRLS